MKYLLKTEDNIDSFLDQIARAAYSVVEETVPEGRREDVLMGLYVALSHVVTSNLRSGGNPEPPPGKEDVGDPFFPSSRAIS